MNISATPPSSRSVIDAPLVVVAMVGYRTTSEICKCLNALSASRYKNFSVSICENGGKAAFDDLTAAVSKLGSGSISTPLPSTQLAAEAWTGALAQGGQRIDIYRSRHNLGFAAGVNLTIRQIESDHGWSALWLLNPDTEPAPEALGALVERAAAGDYAIVGSRLVFKDTRRVQAYGGRWRALLARSVNIGMFAPEDAATDVPAIETQMTYVLGASLYATRKFVEKAGAMDEGYFLYYEEVDWCYRRGSGRLGYAHHALVYHDHGTSSGVNTTRRNRSRLSAYLFERNKLLFSRRFYPAAYPLTVIVALVLTSQFLVAGAPKTFFAALSGWLAGLRGERGPPAFLAESK